MKVKNYNFNKIFKDQDNFIEDEYNLESEKIDTFD